METACALVLHKPYYLSSWRFRSYLLFTVFLSLFPSLGERVLATGREGGLFFERWACASRDDLWLGPAGAVWMKLWAVPPPSMFLLFKTKRKLRRGKTIRTEMCLVVSVAQLHPSPSIVDVLGGIFGNLILLQSIKENYVKIVLIVQLAPPRDRTVTAETGVGM